MANKKEKTQKTTKSSNTGKTTKAATTRKRTLSKAQKLQNELQIVQASNEQLTKYLNESKQELSVSRSKVATIIQIIIARFDGDGINDLELPTGSTRIWWWAVWNSREIMKMITEIVTILRA